MTIGADEITLRDLRKDAVTAPPLSNHVAHFGNLVASGTMIPVHRCGMEGETAIRAALASL
jgi:hypothetical protein